MKCNHENKEQHCDCGDIYWCPDCGSLGWEHEVAVNWTDLTPYERIFGRAKPVKWKTKIDWTTPRMTNDAK